jgi:5-formyltetrahydrofolate cyclo-ligase
MAPGAALAYALSVARSERELDPHPAEAKAALRREILSVRDALDPVARTRLSAAALTRVAGLDAFRLARSVLGYASFGSELDTRSFLREVLASGRVLVLPRVERAARRLALHRVRDLDADLEAGTWGIPEPGPGRCEPVAPTEIDFVLVPGLVFDPTGGRIGYGAGYYDRLLASWPSPVPPLVAAAFELQIVPAVPVLPGDHRVDLVATEARTYAARRHEPSADPQEDP